MLSFDSVSLLILSSGVKIGDDLRLSTSIKDDHSCVKLRMTQGNREKLTKELELSASQFSLLVSSNIDELITNFCPAIIKLHKNQEGLFFFFFFFFFFLRYIKWLTHLT